MARSGPRWLWIGIVVVILAWLLPATFVVVYDPGAPHDPLPMEDALPGAGTRPFLLARGYVLDWSIETGVGSAVTRTHYQVERGPLDRHAARFPLALRFATNHTEDLDAVELLVTEAPGWADDDAWSLVARADVETPGAPDVVLTCRTVVPASATAFRIREVRDGRPTNAVSRSMLSAPTVLGRVYDEIAWRPAFRWLPGDR